jgi:hypothetical protein
VTTKNKIISQTAAIFLLHEQPSDKILIKKTIVIFFTKSGTVERILEIENSFEDKRDDSFLI